jgi:hypothetical protein
VIADEQGTESSPGWDVLSDVIRARVAEMRRLKAMAGSANKPLPPMPLKSLREVHEEVAVSRPRIPRDTPVAAVGQREGGSTD